eukprot:TRINITY_DN8286_c0_g1_i7.p1 TRINITY_DN8286_c0_g1~~TRINITY_DN8286_c0_g1_i7.p1  ORF type:complete len:492 (-),score=47.22 TRINITY_DN8286_c0_g1_i7:98-1573(-)
MAIYIYVTQCGLIPLFSSLLAAVVFAVDVAVDNTTTDVGLVFVQKKASPLKGLDVQYTKAAGICLDASDRSPTYFRSFSSDYTVATCQSLCGSKSWCGAFSYGTGHFLIGKCCLFSSVSGAATVDDKPSGFEMAPTDGDGPYGPVVGGGGLFVGFMDCYYKSEQTPTPVPAPTPTPAPTDGVYTKDAGSCEDANGNTPTSFMSFSADYTVASCQSLCDSMSWCGAVTFKQSVAQGPCALFSSVSGAATVDDKPAGFMANVKEYSYGPVARGGQLTKGTMDCYYKSEQTPTPVPAPTPTPAPTDGGMFGDPHVTFNGTRSTIHLPTQKYTKLVEQSGVAILAKGGPDEEASDNWIFSVAVFENGQEKARLDQALGNLSARDALMNLVVGNVTSHPKRAVTTLGKNLRMTSAREEVVFLHEPTGLEFVVASRPSTKMAANSHHLNIRFSKGLVSSGVGRATGALPEIWGFQPLSSDVESLILRRNVSRRPKRM